MTDGNDLRIGDVARLCGVSADTIRHYEKCGLLSRVARTSNGYRLYSDADVRRVLLVRNALAIGFRLRELTDILKSRDAGRLPCRAVREAAVGKLTEIDDRIRELKKFREQLRAVINDWNNRLEQVGDDAPANLLESLVRQGENDENPRNFDHNDAAHSGRRTRAARRLPRKDRQP